MTVNYQKRKNTELFKSLEEKETLFLSKVQNYIPTYNRFFELNETNFNNINLNHKWYLSSVKYNSTTEEVDCKVKNINNDKTKSKPIFFKMAPLLDPFKYLVGKYDVLDEAKLFTLPTLTNTTDVHEKFMDLNNAAYIDGFFVYLTNSLLEKYSTFTHGLEYFGSFLAIKNNYEVNVFDDLEYLDSSDYFHKNRGKLFTVDDFDHILQQELPLKKPPIKIEQDTELVVPEFSDAIFDNLFEDTLPGLEDNSKREDLVDLTHFDLLPSKENTITTRSTSTCSSRTSHTSSEGSFPVDELDQEQNEREEKNEDVDFEDVDENLGDKADNDDDYDDNDFEDVVEDEEGEEGDEEDEEDDEEIIKATIHSFPVQVITMESCEDTFDNLILNNDLTNEEWYSALMQIIMILLTYQKCFAFTHNDLHTNNVMYNTTDKKFLYYRYNKIVYKVPTFGRIFKIIDFGRSIYKFDGHLFCSDSFQEGGDAAGQYNTEPYLNEKKARLEPNYSFDLCRLACSIFDYIVEDLNEVKDLKKCKDPVKRIITEWCLDDNGVNMLYKTNGADRYPDFKLYKMIARCVHKHTPQAQLVRPEFKRFEMNGFSQKDKKEKEHIFDMDNLPPFY